MAPKINPNRKPRICPNCRGNMVKKGVTNYGKPNWICQSCRRTSVHPIVYK